MKRINQFLLIALGAITMVSCNKEQEINNGVEETSKSFISFKAVADAPTKASLTDDYETNQVFKGAWEPTDIISVDYGDGVYADAQWNATTKSFSGNDIIEGENLLAYFPKTEDGIFAFSGENRKQNGNAYNSKFDLMYSDLFSLSEDGEEVTVSMHRSTAIQYFHLTSSDTAEWANLKVKSATLEVTGSDAVIAAGTVYFDENGDFDFDDGQNSITITFNDGTEPLAENAQLWFNVLPCHVESMTITVELENGYTWTKTNTFGGNGYTFAAGKLGYVKGAPEYKYTGAMPDYETYTFVSFEAETEGITLESDHYTIQLLKGESSNTKPAWVSNEARVYAGGSVVVSAKKEIVKIIYDYSINANKNGVAPSIESVNGNKNAGSWNAESKTWTGSDKIVTLSTSGTAGNLGFKSITVFFDDVEVPAINVTGISLDKTSAELEVGATVTLIASIQPENATNKSVTWSSSDENVATVENGKVRALSAGSAVITATTEDGNYTATCNVAVTKSDRITVTKTMAEIVEANGYTISEGNSATIYTSFNLDDKVTISTSGQANCGSFWNSNDIVDWRLYQAKSGDIKISVPNGYELVSVTLRYSNTNNGKLIEGPASGVAASVSGRTVTYKVGNTGSATNGQVRITEIAVSYKIAEAAHEYLITLPSVEGGTLTASHEKAEAGAIVTVTATPKANLVLKSLSAGVEGETLSNNVLTFTMPAEDVIVSAEFGSTSDPVTGTINFSSNDVKIDAASVTGDDDLGNTWTITTVGTTSFTANSAYYQVGASKSPATSITFTTTLPTSVNVTSMSAKFGGFSGTTGTVALKVGETNIGTGSLNATADVIVESTKSATGTVLTVTVTGIDKGVKVYNISYVYTTVTSEGSND